MPKENKKRGRRAQTTKRKLEDTEVHEADGEQFHDQKRQKTLGLYEDSGFRLADDSRDSPQDTYSGDGTSEAPFYGLLDEEEQEYFKRADGLLELDQFENTEERLLFLENVYKEADGKELKLACSQSCSRLLERLILLSSARLLKTLFEKFSGHFLHLFQHRFASHCCETLFIQSAPAVTQELLHPSFEDEAHHPGTTEPVVSMENLFLHTINELSGHVGYLMTDRFASHTLRVLLVVLAGEKLDMDSTNSILKSKKKEHIDVVRAKNSARTTLETRAVPEAFTAALERLVDESIAGLDTHYLRSLTTHQIGNPMLQLLVRLELKSFGKQRINDKKSIIRTLLPDEPIIEGSESASFINGLVYDPIGSRLLETIIENCPGKMFKTIYKELFRERIGSLARNEIAGYVVSKILERLSREDLERSLDLILPQIPNLAKRGRTATLKTLVERCGVRGVETAELAKGLREAYSEEDDENLRLTKLLGLEISSLEPQQLEPAIQSSESSELALPLPQTVNVTNVQSSKHGSFLAQSMLRSAGPLSTLIFDAISNIPGEICMQLALNPILSPILQTALTVPHSPLIFRRKLITRFYSHIRDLALDSSGSHMVDAIWKGTQGMAFVRERVAEELAENESTLRASFSGRKVWRNWNMDLYRRRRGDWVRMIRESVGNDGFLSFPSGEDADTGGGRAAVHHDPETLAATGRAGRPRVVANEDAAAKNGGKKVPTFGAAANVNGKSKLDLARQRHARDRGKLSAQKGTAGGGKAL